MIRRAPLTACQAMSGLAILTSCCVPPLPAVIALFVDYDSLSELVSIGTLLVMCLVANALLFRRYYPGLPRLRYSRCARLAGVQTSELTSSGSLVAAPWVVRHGIPWSRQGHDMELQGMPHTLPPLFSVRRWGTVESAEGQSVMPFTVPGARLPLKVRQWLVIGHLLLINGLCIGALQCP